MKKYTVIKFEFSTILLPNFFKKQITQDNISESDFFDDLYLAERHRKKLSEESPDNIFVIREYTIAAEDGYVFPIEYKNLEM